MAKVRKNGVKECTINNSQIKMYNGLLENFLTEWMNAKKVINKENYIVTYDDVINTLAQRYANGEFSQWVMTDSDHAQMRCNRPDGLMEFIELYPIGYVRTGVTYQLLDPKEYTDDDLWCYGSVYYTDRKEFDALPLEIKMECVFEATGGFDRIGTPEESMKSWLKFVNTK
jgi:hypothetical protein